MILITHISNLLKLSREEDFCKQRSGVKMTILLTTESIALPGAFRTFVATVHFHAVLDRLNRLSVDGDCEENRSVFRQHLHRLFSNTKQLLVLSVSGGV